MTTLTLTLNGEEVSAPAEPRTHLADFVREAHRFTGTHLGCEQGVCGACTVFVEGRPVRACLTLALTCEGADVRTVEGFDDDPLMARLRAAFSAHHALQCGYCTPGMLATAYDICRRLPHADESRIRAELAGNLCRCTGYQGIVEAIGAVLAEGAPAAALRPFSRDREVGASSAASAAVAAAPKRVANGEVVAPPDLALDDAARIERTLTVAAPPADVWPLVRDPESLVALIPGAHIEAMGRDGAFRGRYQASLGPMRPTFAGVAAMRTNEAQRSGVVFGEGRDGMSGTRLQGRLSFRVLPGDGDATALTLSAHYRLSGALAQFGRPAIVAAVADRVLKNAGETLAARAKGSPATHEPAASRGIGATLRELLARLFGRQS